MSDDELWHQLMNARADPTGIDHRFLDAVAREVFSGEATGRVYPARADEDEDAEWNEDESRYGDPNDDD